ncbi:ribonuclease H2 subunit C [Patagioenas fasciata]|uniref:ribonuclease H2 subunit C n=1 Tax=Patagioenas fasciata TaxID=372321 RepID=UPI003A99E85E
MVPAGPAPQSDNSHHSPRLPAPFRRRACVTSGVSSMAGGTRIRSGAPGLPRLRLQMLPCRIQFNGAAPVDKFMGEPVEENGDLWASFRGRRLGGRELLLPHGFQGLVLQAGGDPQEPWVTVTGTFDRVMDWGADTVPSPNMGLALALQWGPVAVGIHAPVTDDDEEAEP